MRANLHILLCICLTTLVFAACSKDNPTGGGPSGAAVTGIVIDATTTNPVGNVDLSTMPATTAVTTDSTGHFSLGNVAAGTYSLSATKTGYATSTVALTIVDGQNKQLVITLVPGGDNGDSLRAPSDPIPGNNASGQSTYLTLGWSSIGTAADSLRYDVYFGKNSAPEIAAENLTVNSLQRSGLELNTSYYWRVIVKDKRGRQKSSPVWSFKTTDLANNNPPTIPYDPTPVNGAASQPYKLTLRWKSGDPDSDPLKYDVYMGTDNTPSTSIATDLTSTSFPVTDLQQNATYYWRVVAKDNHNGVTSSPVWSFTIKTNLAPNPPIIPKPVNGAVEQPVSPSLQWSSSDDDGDSLTYDIYLGLNNPPTTAIVTNHPTNVFVPISLAENTTYYWRVVAKDGHGGVTSGPVWSFTTATLPKQGLVAYYPFNGNADDQSGRGHHGENHGAILTTDRYGRENQAYQFGSGMYISVPHSNELTMLDNDFTVAAWIKPVGSQVGYAGIVVKCTPTAPEQGYQMVMQNPSTFASQFGTQNSLKPVYFDYQAGTVSLGNWHFVAMTINRSTRTVRLYVDGKLTGSTVNERLGYSITNTEPLLIGVERQSKLYFTGSIDDVRIYNRVLSDSELKVLSEQ